MAILWALLVAFCLVGAFLKHQNATLMAILVAVMWTLVRIINEGIEATKELFANKKE